MEGSSRSHDYDDRLSPRSRDRKSRRRRKSSSRSPNDRSRRKRRSSRSRSKERRVKRSSRSDSLKREMADSRSTKRFKEASPEQVEEKKREIEEKAAEEKRLNRILKARALAAIDPLADLETPINRGRFQPIDSLEAGDEEDAPAQGGAAGDDDDEDDPLAAFMKSIRGDAVPQVGMTTSVQEEEEEGEDMETKPIGTITFEEIQALSRGNGQEHSEGASAQDSQTPNEQQNGSNQDVNMTDGNDEAKKESSVKVVPSEDKIEQNMTSGDRKETVESGAQKEEEDEEDDDEYYKAFMESLKAGKTDGKSAVNGEGKTPDVKGDENGKETTNADNKEENNNKASLVGVSSRREHRYYDDDDDDYMLDYDSHGDDGDDFFAKRKKFEEKKDLKPVDHSKIEYEPFRKNFWVEPEEIAKLTKEEVVKLRAELNDIKVRGKKPPRPITDWYQCGLRNLALAVINKKEYAKPTPVQCQAIPAIMSGRDVIGIAETGSGKTLAFLLPMFRHILDQRELADGDGPVSLIMTPTRELATQIYKECEDFCRALNLNVVAVYGGASIGPQLSALRRGAEIVVCTPGRMIEVLCLNNGKLTNLQRVTYVVLDEADRMFDMGFEPQISRIIGNIRPKRQTVMFSATFEKHVENLAKKILNQPIEIVVGKRGQTCSNVEQFVEVREEREKFLRLLELLGIWSGKGQILIFVERQIEADELYKELLKMGYYPLVLHGGQDQTDRDFTISDFKKGVRDIMIATSVCARGLDVRSLILVINFSCPNHAEDYVHRIGRTGRAGNKGTAYTFITPEQGEYASVLIKALNMGENNTIPEELQKLADQYQEQVDNGEKEFHKHNVRQGKGYKFDKAEREKVKKERNLIKKQYNLGDSDEEAEEVKESGDEKSYDSDDSETKEKENEKEKKGSEKSNNKAKKGPSIKDILSEEEAKTGALSAGQRAALTALRENKSKLDIIAAAEAAIRNYVDDLIKSKPKKTFEDSRKAVEKIGKKWAELEQERNQHFKHELVINDYPQQARWKVTQRDFLDSIFELTRCTVSVKGLHYEPGRKVPEGERKIYLLIEGISRMDIDHAHSEIKRVLEEAATNSLYSKAGPGRYAILGPSHQD